MPPKTKRQFVKDELVFAQMKGYPPWPAKIESDLPPGKKSSGRYSVFFFGTSDRAKLPPNKLYPYRQYKHKYGIERPLTKKFMAEFNEALKIIAELAPPETEHVSEENHSSSEMEESVCEDVSLNETGPDTPGSSISAHVDANNSISASEEEQNSAHSVAPSPDIPEDSHSPQPPSNSASPSSEVPWNSAPASPEQVSNSPPLSPEMPSTSAPTSPEAASHSVSPTPEASSSNIASPRPAKLSYSDLYEQYGELLKFVEENQENIQRKLTSKDAEKARAKQRKYEKIVASKQEKLLKTMRLKFRDLLLNFDSTIRSSLSIGKTDIKSCLRIFKKIQECDLPLVGIIYYGDAIKQLITTLRKCRKFKDPRVKESADKCLVKIGKFIQESR